MLSRGAGLKHACAPLHYWCLQEGMALYEKAIQQSPGYAPAYYNMGVLTSEAKQVRACNGRQARAQFQLKGCMLE